MGAVTTWRGLGLTLAEIADLTERYLGRPDENIGPHLAGLLQAVRERTHFHIGELAEPPERLDVLRPSVDRS